MLRRENGGSDGLYGVYDDVVGDDDDDTFMNFFYVPFVLTCENYLYKTNL